MWRKLQVLRSNLVGSKDFRNGSIELGSGHRLGVGCLGFDGHHLPLQFNNTHIFVIADGLQTLNFESEVVRPLP